MKRLLFVLLGVVVSSIGVFAQAQFGVKAGLNFSNMSVKVAGEIVDDIKFKPGISIGAFADFGLTDLFAIETGLTLENKGFKTEEEEKLYGKKIEETTTMNVIYAIVPVQARLNFSNFYVLAGPYFGIGLSGKIRVKTTYDGETEKDDDSIEFGNDAEESDMKRMDVGLGLGAGCEIADNLGVRLGYDLGLSNLAPGGDSKNKMKNGSVNISATFKF